MQSEISINHQTPVPPVTDELVQFHIEHFDYEDDWGVQFSLLNDKVTTMEILQAVGIGLIRLPGLNPTRVELVSVQQ